jgi:hypothetical protein
MVTYVVVGVLTLAGVVALIWVTRLVLVPKEIHVKSRTSFGVLWMCDHCEAVVRKRNFQEHGVHCAQRPAEAGKRRR